MARVIPLRWLLVVLLELLRRGERFAKDNPFRGDSELADQRLVPARAGLEDGEGAPNGCGLADVMEQDDVVGEV